MDGGHTSGDHHPWAMTNVTCQKPGKPVAKLVPADWNIDDIYNFMAGKGAVAGDVVSPAVSDEEWGRTQVILARHS